MEHPELKKIFKNDPKLVAPTKIASRGGFCLHGLPVPSGEVVEVPAHVAKDLLATGKCVLSEEHKT